MFTLNRLAAMLTLAILASSLVSAHPLDSSGWRLWLDKAAVWQNDTLYMPDEVNLPQMPVNPPTGGWSVLNEQAGKAVSLPSTVEEHYWGADGLKAYQGEYAFEADDPTPKIGNYKGVSWWWRSFETPKLKPGQRAIISSRGARLRAEVYCNGKLVGYTIMTELPFEADVTSALRTDGPNRLAVRITNPGGRLDWIDPATTKWGKYDIPNSHGFGGLDAGIELDVRDEVEVCDLAILNRADPRSVIIKSTLRSHGAAYQGPVHYSIADSEGKLVWQVEVPTSIQADGQAQQVITARVPSASLWNLDTPILYTATAKIPTLENSSKKTRFGFRWFCPEGIGSDATLRLNNKRIVLRSAISWGFWGINGLWPTKELAIKEVESAKTLGLNCLQAHRNLAKPEELAVQDERGLLRYVEPGAGLYAVQNGSEQPAGEPLDTSGVGGEPTSFTQKYAVAKTLAMVQRDRSHPSVIIYCIQNEFEPSVRTRSIYYLINEMKKIDPSRLIYLHSGIKPVGQVFSMPYNDKIAVDPEGNGTAGLFDEHTVGGPGNWQDSLYTGPNGQWSHSSGNKKDIVVWGEMLGVASPDDHQKIVEWYTKNNRTGYDLLDHQQILDSTNKFLDQYGFRKAYPTASQLYQSIGRKSYVFWQRLTENIRISDAVDYMVISGWESTSIENHSGLVDAHRNLRSDPKPMQAATAPSLLVIRPRRFTIGKGDTAVVDIHMVNETNLFGKYTLQFEATDAKGRIDRFTRDVSLEGGDKFGQLLCADIQIRSRMAGELSLKATLTDPRLRRTVLSSTQLILVIDTKPTALKKIVMLARGSEGLGEWVKSSGGSVFPMTSSAVPDAVLLGTGAWAASTAHVTESISGTEEPELYRHQPFGTNPLVLTQSGLSKGKCQVEFNLSENFWDAPGKRVFDLALNGQTVLWSFDIFREAGGKFKAIVKRFSVECPDGVLTITLPKVTIDNFSFGAIRITDAAGKCFRYTGNSTPYTDKSGAVWQPLVNTPVEQKEFQALLDNFVQRYGKTLVMISDDAAQARTNAQMLAQAGVWKLQGFVGGSRASWMGSWYFNRPHALFAGLPSGVCLDDRTQVTVDNTEGYLAEAAGMEVVMGYSRDHDRNIGIGGAVITYGKGKVVILSLPGMVSALHGNGSRINPEYARRLVFNALRL